MISKYVNFLFLLFTGEFPELFFKHSNNYIHDSLRVRLYFSINCKRDTTRVYKSECIGFVRGVMCNLDVFAFLGELFIEKLKTMSFMTSIGDIFNKRETVNIISSYTSNSLNRKFTPTKLNKFTKVDTK